MSELTEKSIRTLELPRVLELLAGQAASEEGKERSLSLCPLEDPEEVRRLQAETSAAKMLIGIRGGPSFSGVKNLSGALKRADMGGALNPRELLDVAGALRAARLVRDYAGGEDGMKTCIDYLFHALRANRFLEDKIFGAIVSEEEIADEASPELSAVRRQMRAANSRVRETLQKLITSSHYSKYLQENLITMRSDRYVVPVRAEFRGEVPGLVHDVSSSGATYFIEPMGVVQANNELRELAAKEKKEIDRILAELSAAVSSFSEEIESDYRVLVSLDMIFARGQLSYKLNASEPEIGADGALILRRARHPLLDQKTVVPIDLRLGEAFDTLVITGPNTGGKTVALKTLGLFVLMARCGLHLPADDGSRIPVYRKVLADIGDEQSIEQSLSTFSSHMTNIVAMLGETEPGTLMLFDELGAGTDPVEGAALAVSIIQDSRERGAAVAATTHYAELKVFAMTAPGVQNASCEFDVETLRPTYRIIIGIPGKSNAFAISQRLGLPEKIIEDARSRMDAGSVEFEDVLSRMERRRQEMERDQTETRRLRRQMEEDAAKACQLREQAEAERSGAARKAEAEAARILEEARTAAAQAFEEMDDMRKRREKEEDWQAENTARTDLLRRLNEAEGKLAPRREPEPEAPPSRPIRAGDTVEILPMNRPATVISVNRDGALSLQAGILKISAKENEVRLLEGESQTQKEAQKIIRRSEQKLRSMGAAPEVDLRGMMTDEATAVLDRYLDGAAMAKLTGVTIIHGKGTGALRAAVHADLKRNPLVKSFRLGRYGEGETGVTIVELK